MARPLWTSDEIAAATGGTATGAFAADGVCIDTRAIEAGDLFVALAGARDGHEFVGEALAGGAAGSLASKPVEGASVQVEDTLAALEKLGVAARGRCAAKRCAVTGSVGKTSVTQAIRAGLERAGKAHSSVKSYNNHIGVPLTLARMPPETQRAVFEIGMNHANEIAPLSKMVSPDVAVVTTVGPVHTENFADGEAGVARAKAEIFAGLKPGGVAILNADNSWFGLLAAVGRKAGARVLSFGRSADCDAALTGFSVEGATATVEAVLHGEAISFPIRQTGQHWGPNSLAVLLALEAMDVSRETALAALAAFEPLEGRGAERQIGGVTLIDESYNANPISMASAIATLGLRPAKGRRIVALTDMLELGAEGPKFHAGLAAELDAARIDAVFCAGPLMKSLWTALPATRQGGYADTAEALAPVVVQAVRPGDVVMVKGSHGSKAHVIAKALMAGVSEGGG